MATREGARSARSESNVELYRELIEAFNREGPEGVIPYLDKAIELYDPDLPGGGVFRGHQGVRRFYAQLLDAFEEVVARDEGMYPSGDRVVGFIHSYGRGRDGIELEIRDAHTMTFRDGKIVYWRTYLDRNEALADAGVQDVRPPKP
jgi:ketosteroid isomerase-like protein